MTESRSVIPGSHVDPRPDARIVGPLEPSVQFEISIVLRRRAEPDDAALAGPPLSLAELAHSYGADPADLAEVRTTVEAAGATVVSADAAARLVRVRGTAEVLTTLFGTSLDEVERADGSAGRQRSGELSVPAAMAGPVLAVLGMDDRPRALARYSRASAVANGYTPLQLATAYDFPEGDGKGHTIAIIELGGGFGTTDLDHYFGSLSLTPPTVTAIGVDGATNVVGKDPQGADGEVLLDIEVAGAIAPKADIAVYFAPNTDAGFLDAITQAAHATPAPTAMSISWGQSEDAWTAQSRTAMDSAFADAVLLGVTVTAAAGDNGSGDSVKSGAHADFPASSPHVLACGGTSLVLAADGSIASETVWNDGGQGGATGGGVSDHFAVPTWQASAGVPDRAGHTKTGRGVPDVAAVADPETGYRVVVDGKTMVIGGTSAVAPLWAGLICRLAAAAKKPLGLLQPALYRGVAAGAAAAGFHDVTGGSNGAYSAGLGWDACTGLGSPDGSALTAVVRAVVSS